MKGRAAARFPFLNDIRFAPCKQADRGRSRGHPGRIEDARLCATRRVDLVRLAMVGKAAPKKGKRVKRGGRFAVAPVLEAPRSNLVVDVCVSFQT